VSYSEYNMDPDADPSPRPFADGCLPDSPLSMYMSRDTYDHPERCIDEQSCMYNAYDECSMPQELCTCHHRGDSP
jgi:hypothetical protein